jgi:hypothetical protein
MSKQFKKQLYERVRKDQSSSEFSRVVPGVTVKEPFLRSEFAKKISQSARSELKTLRVWQCVIISDSDC